MKIIHTADWHLNHRLGKIDRTQDLQDRVVKVAEYCQTHDVDVLLIAGDLFESEAKDIEIKESLSHVKSTFANFFARGGIILAVTGNHDRDQKIDVIRAGMQLASPSPKANQCLEPGRMYLLNGMFTARIRDPQGQMVQFVCVPYPYASRYQISTDEYRSREEENRQLQSRVNELRRIKASELDSAFPTVLVAHLNVSGAEVHSLYKMTERDDVLFQYADLNPNWAYVALGHIHKPQMLGGASHVRYSGSLDRLDFGDTHDDHGVVYFEINAGNTVDPVRLPIPGTPFLTIDISDPDTELELLKEKYPNYQHAIVRIRIKFTYSRLSRDQIGRELRKVFSRIHQVEFLTDHETNTNVTRTRDTDKETGKLEDQIDPLAIRNMGFATIVRQYVERELQNDSDEQAILQLLEQFITMDTQS